MQFVAKPMTGGSNRTRHHPAVRCCSDQRNDVLQLPPFQTNDLRESSASVAGSRALSGARTIFPRVPAVVRKDWNDSRAAAEIWIRTTSRRYSKSTEALAASAQLSRLAAATRRARQRSCELNGDSPTRRAASLSSLERLEAASPARATKVAATDGKEGFSVITSNRPARCGEQRGGSNSRVCPKGSDSRALPATRRSSHRRNFARHQAPIFRAQPAPSTARLRSAPRMTGFAAARAIFAHVSPSRHDTEQFRQYSSVRHISLACKRHSEPPGCTSHHRLRGSTSAGTMRSVGHRQARCPDHARADYANASDLDPACRSRPMGNAASSRPNLVGSPYMTLYQKNHGLTAAGYFCRFDFVSSCNTAHDRSMPALCRLVFTGSSPSPRGGATDSADGAGCSGTFCSVETI